MTREEAIICLQGLLENPLINKGSYLAQAIEMAIQALSQEPTDRIEYGTDGNAYKLWISNGKEFEQEPCDDAISRDAVIKDFTQWRGKMAYSFGEDYSGVSVLDKAIRVIKGMPSVTPKSIECEDAISRILKKMWNCRGKHTTSIDKVKMEQIIRDELPSVTQKSETVTEFADRCRECGAKCGKLLKQKTGHWISHYDEDAKEGWYECDRCHTERAFNTDYCPNCGSYNGGGR